MFNLKRLSATTLLALVAGPYLTSAAPLRRQSGGNPNVLVLQFANVLEQLETSFYSQALQTFTAEQFSSVGFSAPEAVLQQITVISTDEATHTSILQEELVSLEVTPVVCEFDFSTALTDVATMASIARVVENVGVGAYLGAASLVTDTTILTAAASIMTVESRHQTLLNIFNGGDAIPSAFDIPLLPQEVLAIAGAFIQPGCDLGITSNVALEITTTTIITVNTLVSMTWEGIPSDLSGFFCQMLAGGMPISISLPLSQCIVPNTVNGPVAIFITSDNQPLVNSVSQRSDVSVVAGPTMIFIDQQQDQIAALIRPPAGVTSGEVGPSGEAGAIPSGEVGATPSGEASATSAGEVGATPSGEASATSAGEAGTTSTGEVSSSGETSATPSGEAGATSSGDAGSVPSGDASAAGGSALTGDGTASAPVAMFTPPIVMIPAPTST